MELNYIRVCGVNYVPRPKGVQKRDCHEGVFEPYCIITQMSNGRFKIEYENYFPDPENILTSNQKRKISNYWFNNIITFYDDVETIFNNLNDNQNNRFVSFSKVFKDENNLQDIYYDSIHYKDKYAINVISKLISNEILNHLGCINN
jgi:hypothetical protein